MFNTIFENNKHNAAVMAMFKADPILPRSGGLFYENT